MSEHNLNTIEGGRSYLVELFAEVIERKDFREYIEERLAGDFACVTARYIHELGQVATENWKFTEAVNNYMVQHDLLEIEEPEGGGTEAAANVVAGIEKLRVVSEELKSFIVYSRELADMVLKGDAPDHAQRTAKMIMNMLGGK